jgi:hypothetical protein
MRRRDSAVMGAPPQPRWSEGGIDAEGLRMLPIAS